MKKHMSAAFRILSFILVCCLLTGCSGLFAPTDKDFSVDGMTITLNSAFTQKEYEGLSAYFESRTALVTVLKEAFTLFEDLGYDTEVLTLQDYAQFVMDANAFEGEPSTENGLTVFTYEKQVDGQDFSYYATVFKGPDAFWLIQFAGTTEDFDGMKAQFNAWAKTVRLS